MKLKYQKPTVKSCITFVDLNIGDLFYMSDETSIYIKIAVTGTNGTNSISLIGGISGNRYTIKDETIVVFVEGTLVIENVVKEI